MPARLTRPRIIVAAISVGALLALLCLPQVLQSQLIPSAVVKGRVLDDSTGAPLPLTNVFISNSTIGAAADAQGRFELKAVPLGTQEIIASIIGYLPGKITLKLTDTREYDAQFRLRPIAIQMPAVEVVGRNPVEWRKQLKRFVDVFFGPSRFAMECALLNPEVLDFSLDEKTDHFSAKAREPLEIRNNALGYRCHYILDFFLDTPESFRGVGVARFVPLESQDENEMHKWKENRREAYFGSKRHFFASLLTNKSAEEGFQVRGVERELLLTALWRGTGSWIDPATLLSPGESTIERKLAFGDLLQVIYRRDGVEKISVMELERASVPVSINGLLVDPLKVTTYGFWANQRAAEMLPIDYLPDE